MLQALTNRRAVTAEIMDSGRMAEADHLEALAGLERINRVSRAADQILQPILDMARREKLDRLSMMDIACGGGDVPIGVAKNLQKGGIAVDLTLLDRSGTAVKQAAGAAAEEGIACHGVEGDALGELPNIQVDIVTNSLFLHHLPERGEVIALLEKMCGLARRMVVISDLRRSRRGFVAAWTACRVLSRSPIVHHDGPASVRAAWKISELADFAAGAGMTNVRIRSCWPWRMLLVWERDRGA